jgi:mono/diheme cytochrome c family protein
MTCLATALILLANQACCQAPMRPPREAMEAAGAARKLFERRVRPLFAAHCGECHGAKKQEAGLRLDTAAGIARGAESGPVLVPGEPDESRLIEVLRHDGPVRMPPQRKLPEESIAALVRWIELGAALPEEPSRHSGQPSAEPARSHWSFQPVRRPSVPAGKGARSAIDAFVAEQLALQGLALSPAASRSALIRRATFDLWGLPPTPEEVASFEADQQPHAFERLVDRLLASPRFGERWGRHWLDVARYADTKGYVRLLENPAYTSAWTYRDYVIRAFNEDLPFDRFILEQLAADRLATPEDPRPLAALGFLTLGERFINSRHDIIDDRIDVVTRGLMGLTVSCARCHDHKFDPVTTQEYYGLHGIFNNSIEPHVPALIVPAAELPRFAGYLRELEARQARLDAYLREQQRQLEAMFRARAAEYLLAAQRESVQANYLATMFLVDAAKDLNPAMIQRWGRLLEETRRRHDPVLAAWHALARPEAGEEESFEERAARLIDRWRDAPDRGQPINAIVLQALSARPVRDLADLAARYAELFKQADQQWQEAAARDPRARGLAQAGWEELRRLLYGPGAPPVVALSDLEEFLFVDATTQNQFQERVREVENWIATCGAAPHAHVLIDAAAPSPARVFIRGNASNPGAVVPRQFLNVLTKGAARPFEQGSGRLELAQAVADPQNPLTARVFVNRVWRQLFGAGLVRTPSDFGVRGEPPSHPALLDYLASEFIAQGWSVKRLVRMMMHSAVYQQQSNATAESLRADPENVWLSRMSRRRLDWEALHDALLAVSGGLDNQPGGPPAGQPADPGSGRRAVYRLVDRLRLASALRTFDFAPPDATSPQRHLTTVPQQALFLMNSPFMRACVVQLAARDELDEARPLHERVEALCRLLFARPALPVEQQLAAEYVARGQQAAATAAATAGDPFLTPWQEFVQMLLLTNEFAHVD